MRWNWELSDWPKFQWNSASLTEFEHQFLLRSGQLAGILLHLEPDERNSVLLESLCSEAVTTSEIEGQILDRASVQSSIKQQLGIPTESRRIPPSEQGISEVMVDVHQNYRQPMQSETLFSWHRSLMRGRSDLMNIGCYRTTLEPMQIVSLERYSDLPRVHFEAPPSSRVSTEMEAFVDWFNESSQSLPPLTRAGIAHIYFESIHPFEDGNGRIGRALTEKSISQSIGNPTYTSLAQVILSKRKSYYAALEQASVTLDLTDWLVWFSQTALEAQSQSLALVEVILTKTRILDGLRGHLNSRQEKAIMRMFKEGVEGFKGGLSAANYRKITGASTATATRDLADLVEKGALLRNGELRYARYHLNTTH